MSEPILLYDVHCQLCERDCRTRRKWAATCDDCDAKEQRELEAAYALPGPNSYTWAQHRRRERWRREDA